MGLPPGLGFRTKGKLAVEICTETFADGVQLDFLCGDEAYGNCTELREFCENSGQGYVLRVRSNFHLTPARGATQWSPPETTSTATTGEDISHGTAPSSPRDLGDGSARS
jgi:SRSO17 transposase